MMQKFRSETKQQVELLSDKGRIIFALLTCEKLYPNYVFFRNHFHWGDERLLGDAIIGIYEYIIKKDKSEIKHLLDEVESITPDTGEFPDVTASFALDACTAVYSTLKYISFKNIDDLVDVASYAIDTVDMYVQEKENLEYSDPEFESKIANDPYMIAEKRRQQTLLDRLSELAERVSIDAISELRDEKAIIDIDALKG